MAIEPLTVAHMPDGYPEIRRTVGECLLDASQRLRMSASGMHDAMVACAGDVRAAMNLSGLSQSRLYGLLRKHGLRLGP